MSFKTRLNTIARGVEHNKMCHHCQPLKMQLHLEAKTSEKLKTSIFISTDKYAVRPGANKAVRLMLTRFYKEITCCYYYYIYA